MLAKENYLKTANPRGQCNLNTLKCILNNNINNSIRIILVEVHDNFVEIKQCFLERGKVLLEEVCNNSVHKYRLEAHINLSTVLMEYG